MKQNINLNSEDEEDDFIDTECGFGFCKKIKCLQRFANKTVYVIVYGALGCIFSAAYAYSNSTLSTIEKRYKIPSKVTGMISVGNDMSSLLATMLLSYYAGKGHRPRWIAVGIYSVALYCFINLLPHILWGAGDDALALTVEHGGAPDADLTAEILMTQKRKTLCRAGLNDSLAGAECRVPGALDDSGLAPATLFFLANFVSGIGGSLYYTLGVSYMDDNIKKSKTPFLVSVSYFMRMLGPALGYTLGSYFLKMYVSPTLTPTITNSDPRWLGAWWAGWLIVGVALVILGSILGLFPRTMPRTVQRQREALRRGASAEEDKKQAAAKVAEKASFKDMKKTIGRLITNKIYMCNTLAAIFYMFGYMPFWIYTPKYIEVQYHTTASRASFFTGSVGLVFSAVGVLISGFVITRFKPNARYLAAWNVLVAIISVLAIFSYTFLGCEQSDIQSSQMASHTADVRQECNSQCHCDFVKYSPVCSEDGRTTFISACHAGCTDHHTENGTKIFTGCSCISGSVSSYLISDVSSNTVFTITEDTTTTANMSEIISPTFATFIPTISSNESIAAYIKPEKITQNLSVGGRAFPGPCPVDCTAKFYAYIAIVCLLKFSGATGRTSNFLVSVRCIDEQDKAASLGFGMMLFNLFVFIPSPIIFGYIIDGTCVVWGKTCSGTGNCWQYNGEAMRYVLNFTAAAFVAIGTMFDVGVWYYVKDLQIFDEEEKDEKKTHVGEDAAQELIEVHRTEDGHPAVRSQLLNNTNANTDDEDRT